MTQPKSQKEVLRTLVSPELVSCLQALFPDRLPTDVVPQEAFARLIGTQDVIRCLKAALDEQAKKNTVF